MKQNHLVLTLSVTRESLKLLFAGLYIRRVRAVSRASKAACRRSPTLPYSRVAKSPPCVDSLRTSAACLALEGCNQWAERRCCFAAGLPSQLPHQLGGLC